MPMVTKGRSRRRDLPFIRQATTVVADQRPSPPKTARPTRRKRPPLVATTASVAVHLTLVALMGAQFAQRRSDPVIMDPPVMISLEALAAPPTPAPTEEAPSDKARPATTRPDPPKLEFKPREVRVPTPPPFSLPLPEPTRDSRPTPPSPPSRESASSPPPQPSAPPATTASGTVDPTWQGRVMAKLDSVKRYPRGARARRIEGVAHVRFAVDRTGRVGRVSLARSSGYADLDQEAMAAVRRAQPLPRPPADMPGDPIDLTVEIEFLTAL